LNETAGSGWGGAQRFRFPTLTLAQAFIDWASLQRPAWLANDTRSA